MLIKKILDNECDVITKNKRSSPKVEPFMLLMWLRKLFVRLLIEGNITQLTIQLIKNYFLVSNIWVFYDIVLCLYIPPTSLTIWFIFFTPYVETEQTRTMNATIYVIAENKRLGTNSYWQMSYLKLTKNSYAWCIKCLLSTHIMH